MATLYVVATPIGNLEDITLRAVRVLKEAGLIAAEDTRQTRKLLVHYGIDTPVTSYHEHNEKEKSRELVERLMQGTDVALVSDAGTPGISDPGYRLIKVAVENSVNVVAIPGPSALVSVLSVSALPIDEFTFRGFVPQSKKKREKFFLELRGTEQTCVMYDSPRRIMDTLDAVVEVLGDVRVVVAREMTKLYEEVLRGTAKSVRDELTGRTVKGEITLVLRTSKEAGKEAAGAGGVDMEIRALLEKGFQLKEVARAVAAEFDLPKREAYARALEVKASLKQNG